MLEIIKWPLRKLIPGHLREKYWKHQQLKPYLDALKTAPAQPVWLGWDDFEHLQKRYNNSVKSGYGYEPEDLVKRGEEYSSRLLAAIGEDRLRISTTLELGCYDGMVSRSLKRRGMQAVAVDIDSGHFDERAVAEGVRFAEMDAARLEFPAQSFDCVFSFNGFEHFNNPGLVLQEAARVTRTGMYIYLYFGPLYMSPYGLHTRRSVPIPYCQFLFPDEYLDRVRTQKGLTPMAEHRKELSHLSITDYRAIWKNNSHQLERLVYKEIIDDSHLGLVKEFPSCFKSKTQDFDNLRVATIEVLFRKKA